MLILNRIIKLENSRLTKVVLLWDRELGQQNRNTIKTWSGEVDNIFQKYNLGYLGQNIQLFPLRETINSLRNNMIANQCSNLKIKCREKTQLRTYIKFKNFDKKPPMLMKPLSYIQRKYLSKFNVSCLELKICTGRYINQPETDRICTADLSCQELRIVESECHFLLTCPAYDTLRHAWLARLEVPENFDQLNDTEKIDIAINNIENVKPTAQFIVDAFNLRSRLALLRTVQS